MAQWLMSPTRNHKVVSSTPGLVQWIKDLVGLWLWCGPVATAPIRPLAWELPYAMGVALKRQKKKKIKKRNDDTHYTGCLKSLNRFFSECWRRWGATGGTCF